jgi:hypothetical protein
MSYRIQTMNTEQIKEFFEGGERTDMLTKELETLLKVVKLNPDRLSQLVDIRGVCGSRLDPEACVPIPPGTLLEITAELAMDMIKGMKVGDKDSQWHVGGLGSRWYDIDPRPYGLDYIRCAFYSKRSYNKPWTFKTPYIIQITCEKGRD